MRTRLGHSGHHTSHVEMYFEVSLIGPQLPLQFRRDWIGAQDEVDKTEKQISRPCETKLSKRTEIIKSRHVKWKRYT